MTSLKHALAATSSPRRRRLLLRLVTSLGVAAGLSLATSASAQTLRFSSTTPGGIASTGNTLGLAKATNSNGPGTQDSIGTFISLDPASVDNIPANPGNPWPMGTTFDWMQNGSAGVLTLPPGAEVLYAELVWGGSYEYFPENVTAFINDPVTLGFGNDTAVVTPAAATALTINETAFSNFPVRYYVRSANVTNFIKMHGEGSYDVSGVPATQTTTINSLNAAGWSLVVAFRGEDQPIRNLSIFVGGSFVDEDSQQDYTVSGFCAPPFGIVEGNVVVSALEGDADLAGDDLLIAPTINDTFVNLSGPNNPATNFFCSQINDAQGQLDTQGSFGMANHDATNGVNVSGGRQGWDLTTVPLSSQDGQLFAGQSSAVIRTNTTGDSFVPTLVAIEIDVKSPDFTDGSTTMASMDPVSIGDQLTITATLSNTGEAPASNLRFLLPTEAGLTFSSITTDGTNGDINGNPVTAPMVATGGVDAGIIGINQTRVVAVTYDVTAAPNNGASFLFLPTWEHSFQVCEGDAPISESYTSQVISVAYLDNTGNGGAGGMGGAGAMGGAGGMGGAGASGAAGGADGDDDDDLLAQGGTCACSTPGGPQPGSAAGLLALLGFALAGARRRRR